ncbi:MULTISPECIES: amino acid ABC transporter permease [Variovorax]|uniref:ABC transporter permease subunit n=1 Tax=Variovorax ginsengisoli TaxID=363844 RepID=A0ABT8S956_9BURK|nr:MULTISPECIES: ABC transporter permease subunit [Variovorax]MDM0042345.1 ABC transporter permease subunit [Variovorax sp. J22R193]MDM0054599.1 ABC transporter permease subunit [Variovorax sp. J22G47]MDM0060950.1 ABC transporter permease subunit [Variovorax sp. J22G21]MDM0122144.1 ABC transporter permease subunit [Variovorax sp. J2L1-78]MDM0131327.1 ABC transporter permease subunit [Variovorax sp. J2L1-63]
MRRVVWQVLAALIVIGVFSWLIGNAQANLGARNVASGFGFLQREAGLPIAEHLIPYTPADSYLRALVVGMLNTLWVAFWGIVLATILGTVIGVARLSKNWLLAKLMSAYVEFFRDLPLLLQLFLWYALLQGLPPVRQAIHPIAGVYLSNRGLSFPVLDWQTAHSWTLLAFILGLIATVISAKRATRKSLDDGRQRATWPTAVLLMAVMPATVVITLGAPFALDMPSPRSFNIRGGVTVSPEFFALLFGLVIYNAAFIAEIVRSGIQSVSHGQIEASRALGLKSSNTLKWIVFPQALRVIVPPLTSQYLNLAKQSSLAVAIGYQDIVSIATTAMNQNGQAVELVAIIMGVYLTISLSISALMNHYNARIALVER